MTERLDALHLRSKGRHPPPPPTAEVYAALLSFDISSVPRPVEDSDATVLQDDGNHVTRRQMRILSSINKGIEDCRLKLTQPRSIEACLQLRGRLAELRGAVHQLNRQVPSVQAGKEAAMAQINALEEDLEEWDRSLGPHVQSVVFDSGEFS